MGFSYSGNPQTSLKDRVRFELGDTDRARVKFSDEEILSALSESSNGWSQAAASLARNLATRFSQQADVRVGSLTIDYSKLALQWNEIASHLEAKSGSGSAPPPSGIVAALEDDPIFRKGMHDSSEGGGSRRYPPEGSRYYS
jgi:hypothetical protein